MLQKMKNALSADKVFFILCCIFSVGITYFVTLNCIDSDASSELVLANHLAETGRILSTDWGYSTELRVLNTQLVYAPLFWVFDDWHLVRFFGSVILQGILVGALFLYVSLLQIDKKIFYISAGLYLLPVSVCYGRIVLYNCYYIPHIALSLVIVGLVFAKNKSASRGLVRLFILMVLSFLGGLGGVRQMLITHAPLVLAVFIIYLMDDFACKQRDIKYEKQRLSYFANTVISAVFFLFGYIINTCYFAKIYQFSDYSNNEIRLMDITSIKDVMYGLLHHFGFRDEIQLISILGVLSVLGVFVCVACIILAIVGVIKYRQHRSVSEAMPSVFFVSYLTVMLLVFAVLGRGFYYLLYLSPVVAWMIPVFAQQFCNIRSDVSPLNMRRILPFVATAVIIVNGVVNSIYLLDHTKFEQKYEGLVFKDRTITRTLEPVVEFLVDNGYERGYATFWNANIITEMTDGAVRFVNVHCNSSTGAVTYNSWLCLKTNRDLVGTKDFVMLEKMYQSVFESKNDLSGCKRVYEDNAYVIYEILER